MEPDKNDDATPIPPTLPVEAPAPEAEFVEAERMDGDGVRGGSPFPSPGGQARFRSFAFVSQNNGLLKPPSIATWVCLLAAWFFLGSRVPFTVFIGLPLNLAAIVLAIVCLTRGGLFTGLSVMLLGSVGSIVVYLVGLFRFLAL